MDNIKKLLIKFDEAKVDIYISYLNLLKNEKGKDGKLTNYWFNNIKESEFINVFKKVYEGGLFIDGDSVTLTYRKRLVITYDYHAYKNKIMLSYPDSIFDFQLVHEGDKISFRKESGKVIYSHSILNPFDTKRKLIGAYGIIKNTRGEFVETIHLDDIAKFKNTSNMKFIWDTWLDRMVLKSVIKRICSIHFKDITKVMDSIDNETNDPNNADLDSLIQNDIYDATTNEELNEIYQINIASAKDRNAFIQLLDKRKKELLIEQKNEAVK